MPRIPRTRFRTYLNRVEAAVTTNDKGRALEDLVAYLFPVIPGVELAERNVLNAFATEEVDVALWNNGAPDGIYFMPNIVLVECKNWSNPCGSQEVAYFVSRLRQRGCDYGILIATNGITGIPEDLTRANFQIATALAEGVRVIVLTLEEIAQLTSSDDLLALLKRKLCQLVASGTNFL